MAQRNIDFGTFPDDPDTDAIRTAFQKVQDNFGELFAGVDTGSVISVNRTSGAGITVSTPTGNVVITANIACVQVHTSTLSIGRDANGSSDTSITASSQTLYVDLPANIANVANINLSGYANVQGNLSVVGNSNLANVGISGNITLGGNIVITGNVSAFNVSATNALSAGTTLSVTGNANVGTLNTATANHYW